MKKFGKILLQNKKNKQGEKFGIFAEKGEKFGKILLKKEKNLTKFC